MPLAKVKCVLRVATEESVASSIHMMRALLEDAMKYGAQRSEGTGGIVKRKESCDDGAMSGYSPKDIPVGLSAPTKPKFPLVLSLISNLKRQIHYSSSSRV